MTGFFPALLLVTIAELGDKTQLLVLALAAKHRPAKVIAGVILALLVLQLTAVIVGRTLYALVPMAYLQFAIGASFIAFGIWMLKKDTGDEENAGSGARTSLGVIATVAATFFIAEFGDKTQLATISLAAKYNSFVGVWLGSTFGMIVADGLALVVGVTAGRRLPQERIKYISAGIFILFGIITLAQAIL
ncbi:MAG: TMEM165/GDT1 family protein [Candidatus Aquicultor sp.]|nr:TMEM165/GDT1 family protein [Candidatus Aquicultor sp.]